MSSLKAGSSEDLKESADLRKVGGSSIKHLGDLPCMFVSTFDEDPFLGDSDVLPDLGKG